MTIIFLPFFSLPVPLSGEMDVCMLTFFLPTQAVFWFLSLEKCCHSQLLAEAAAGSRGEKPVAIGDEEAAYTYRTVGSNKAGWFSAKPLFDVIHKETGGDYLE